VQKYHRLHPLVPLSVFSLFVQGVRRGHTILSQTVVKVSLRGAGDEFFGMLRESDDEK
jgi:hypothetical protein